MTMIAQEMEVRARVIVPGLYRPAPDSAAAALPGRVEWRRSRPEAEELATQAGAFSLTGSTAANDARPTTSAPAIAGP
jgi:hypothetical protein